jgi:hypothetical protein
MEAMTADKSDRVALLRLADALVEDILNASDEDILAEARDDNTDPGAAATQASALFENAAAFAGKERLAAAKAALANRQASAIVTRLDPAVARRRLERIFANDPHAAGKLTRAARKGQGYSDDDVISMLDDLAELGITPGPDEP